MDQFKKRKFFLIINEFAGHRKRFEKAVKSIVPFLQNKGCEVEYSYTQYRGHATELASNAAKTGFNVVVAVGGDGTVNEVTKGLTGTSVTMGIIPMGSGNGLARELGIPMDIVKSAHLLAEGKSTKIDICQFKDQRFLCTSGIGFDAQVADKMSRAKSRGFLRYVQLTIQESITFKPFSIKMKLNGNVIEKKVFIVTFANAKQFGNNAFIAPSADISDGLIDVVIVNPFPKTWLPVFGLALFLKFIPKLSFVETYKTNNISLEFADTAFYHFDGEPGKITIPSEIKIAPEKLQVIAGKNRI